MLHESGLLKPATWTQATSNRQFYLLTKFNIPGD